METNALTCHIHFCSIRYAGLRKELGKVSPIFLCRLTEAAAICYVIRCIKHSIGSVPHLILCEKQSRVVMMDG